VGRLRRRAILLPFRLSHPLHRPLRRATSRECSIRRPAAPRLPRRHFQWLLPLPRRPRISPAFSIRPRAVLRLRAFPPHPDSPAAADSLVNLRGCSIPAADQAVERLPAPPPPLHSRSHRNRRLHQSRWALQGNSRRCSARRVGTPLVTRRRSLGAAALPLRPRRLHLAGRRRRAQRRFSPCLVRATPAPLAARWPPDPASTHESSWRRARARLQAGKAPAEGAAVG